MIQNIKHEVWISATTVVLGLYGFAQKFRMLMFFVAIFPLALKLPSWKRVDQQLTLSKFVCKGCLDEYLFALTLLFYLLRVTKVSH